MQQILRLVSLTAVMALLAGCETGETGSGNATTGSSDESGMTHSAGMTHSPAMTHAPGADAGAAPRLPTEPGQGAFAALKEIVELLENDPDADWGAVNITALRDHLVDMDRVILDSRAVQTDIPDGFEARVTGEGDTVDSVRRMVGAHAAAVQGIRGWIISWSEIPGGVQVRVAGPTSEEALHIQALGVFGFLATESHHQEHHLMLAKGQLVH